MIMVPSSPTWACRLLFVLFLACGLLAGCSDSPFVSFTSSPGWEHRPSSPTTQSAPVGTEVPTSSVTVEDTNQAPWLG
jgi:hypothetical protein